MAAEGAGADAPAAEEGDARVAWVEQRTSTAFKHVKADAFKKAFSDEENM